MFKLNTNANTVLLEISQKLQSIAEGNTVLREVAVNMLPVVKNRIHLEGRDAENNQIGEYSKGYMKVRTGQYLSNGTYSKGKNKDQVRTTGTFTKGKDKGRPRPNYNRDADPKVVLSLTRQMENDFSVQEQDGRIGLGFSNQVNSDKADWAENTYKRKIYGLTPAELEQALGLANDATNKILKNEA